MVRNRLAMTYEIIGSAYRAVRMCVEAEFISNYSKWYIRENKITYIWETSTRKISL